MDISVLKYVNFKKLEILKIHGNNISDIEVLKNVDFKELKN